MVSPANATRKNLNFSRRQEPYVDTIVKLWDKLCALGLLLFIILIVGAKTGFIPVSAQAAERLVDPVFFLIDIPFFCLFVWGAGRFVLWLIKVIIS